MTADRHQLRAAISEEVDRIDRMAAHLWDGDCDFSADSGHPGWSYGHVAAHIARGSDFLSGILLTGSTDAGDLRGNALERSREIDREATRPGAVIITDVEQAVHRFADLVLTLPDEQWSTMPIVTEGRSASVVHIIETWLREMRIHIPALALNYEPNGDPAQGECQLAELLPLNSRLLHSSVSP
ncbi:maleylpyruvate isomerase N-terminal domain-containing protein [Nocardia tengchongensis]|uniref:Maleylpyruvate isomerase N-terminal domain-containing protein n=1 Tax=Nocardia tengchongensis TaxID=2055889 RepID=A0ABX8CLU0_9NOCA|nr:maleylpyruvate isomerase N-terminal domain-containing protein [Nocardia tengchongensis]QVI19470.1 maleylpyruvate isomerase N-terminal domain-containing protein [Nocardia tengchongensis]